MNTIESLGFNATLDELLTLIDPRIAEAVYAHQAELEAQCDSFEELNGDLEIDLKATNWNLENLQDKFDTLENDLAFADDLIAELRAQVERAIRRLEN